MVNWQCDIILPFAVRGYLMFNFDLEDLLELGVRRLAVEGRRLAEYTNNILRFGHNIIEIILYVYPIDLDNLPLGWYEPHHLNH